MSASYDEIRAGVLDFIGAALDETQDDLMKAIGMVADKKGLKVPISVTILPTDDMTVNEILVKLSYVPEKIQIKTEGFTERLKAALKKVASK